MTHSMALPKEVHGFDMFFQDVSRFNLLNIAHSLGGVAQNDCSVSRITCRFQESMIASTQSELMGILSSIRENGENLATKHGGIYLGGELYLTQVGLQCATLDRMIN